MPPAWVLPRKPQHELPDLRQKPRPTWPNTWLPPLPPHKRSVPAQERPRRDQQRQPRRLRQVTRSGRKQSAIGVPEFGPPDLAAQYIELMAEHQQLDILDIRAAATTDEQPEQSSDSEIQQREEHPPILAAAPSQ
jgi:hypothetical protein